VFLLHNFLPKHLIVPVLKNAQGSTMRYLLVFLALVLATADIMAQTAAPASSALTGLALRRQDHKECSAQARQQNIAKRNQAEFVRKCMADRQGARKIAANPTRLNSLSTNIQEG
jgi:hypothetical protein